MSMELTSIAANLSRIAARAARDDRPLIEELCREVHRLCAVVQRLEQEMKVPAKSEGGKASRA